MKTSIRVLALVILLLVSSTANSQTIPSQTVCAGSTATFSISSIPGATYQWQAYSGSTWVNMVDGRNISGARTITLRIADCSGSQSGLPLRLRVIRYGVTTYSNTAYLYVKGVRLHPSNKDICSSPASATFSVSVSSVTSKPTYRWQYSTNNSTWYDITTTGSSPSYSGWTTSNLTVSNIPSTRYFRCRVTSSTCTSYSNSAAYTNIGIASITANPLSGNVCYSNGSINFSVSSNDPSATYNWIREYYEANPILGSPRWIPLEVYDGGGSPSYSGANTKTLTVSNVTAAPYKQSRYYCEVSNCTGTAESNTATYSLLMPPAIASHPSSRTICAGSGTSFYANASGENPVYRWQVSTNNGASYSTITNAGSNPTYSGWTGKTLSVNSVSAGNNGYKYRCYVTGTCSPPAYTNAAILAVDPSVPAVSSQPSNAAVCVGVSSSFTVGSSDVGQSYKWFRSTNGGASYTQITSAGSSPTYSGYTSKTLQLTGTAAANNGYRYYVTMQNACGVASTQSRSLTVNSPITTTQQPSSETVCEGISTSFTHNVSGTIISRKWQVSYNNGSSWSDINASTPKPPTHSGHESATLNISAPLYENSGYRYRSIVTGTNTCSPLTRTSTEVTLNVNELTEIDEHPGQANVCQNDNTSFTVNARGTNLVYQWYLSDNNGSTWTAITQAGTNPTYSGYDTKTLSLTKVIGDNDLNQYKCNITSSCSNLVETDIAVLYVRIPPGTADPLDGPTEACKGETGLSYNVNTIAGADSYTWLLPTGVGGSSLTNSINVDFTDLAESGTVSVTGINTCGASNISSKEITIKTPSEPPLLAVPSENLVCPGSSVNLSLTGGSLGSGAAWKWYSGNCGGTPVGTGESISISSVNQSTSFFVRAEGDCNATECADTLIEVYKTTKITQQPEPATVCYGVDHILTISATGPPDMEYRWFKGTTPLNDFNEESSFTLNEIGYQDAGQYRCVIRSVCDVDGLQSEAVTISVFPPPTINLGETQHFCPGTPLTLNAGAGNESYQWSTGAVTRTIEVSEQGLYSVTVTDAKGCSNSGDVFIIEDPVLPQVDLGFDVSVCLNTAVLLDATDEYDTFIWSDLSQAQQLNITETGKYWIEVGRLNSVCTSSDTVDVLISVPNKDQGLCIVTVSNDGKNLLIWEKLDDPAIVGYNIFKGSSTAGSYTDLGYVANTELSAFIDESSSPETSSDKYTISIVDSCGNESEMSPYHKTIHLAVSPAIPIGFNLSWDHIEVEGLNKSESFPSYFIYRGDSYATLELLDQISSELNQYTDAAPPEGEVYYQISAKKLDACAPSIKKSFDDEDYTHSFSNVEDVFSEVGINGIESTGSLKIYPNPATESAIIEFSNPRHIPHRIVVSDMAGRVVKEVGMIFGEKYELIRDGLYPGMYIIELIGEDHQRASIIFNK